MAEISASGRQRQEDLELEVSPELFRNNLS